MNKLRLKLIAVFLMIACGAIIGIAVNPAQSNASVDCCTSCYRYCECENHSVWDNCYTVACDGSEGSNCTGIGIKCCFPGPKDLEEN